MNRRDFLRISALSSLGLITGCAVNPVTGDSQLMLVSEGREIAIDRQNSPYQFSADYGALQDRALNDYINATGRAIAAHTHRPNMPYSFRGVNATYVNAYAFPGGSIACTRGILLSLDNEAELAALLGHELGHVNARHTAQQMSKGMLVSTLIGGIAAYAGTRDGALGDLASGLGNIGAGALLAKYSRDNERQADALGMEYMVRGHYGPGGMIGLMEMLRSTSKRQPNVIELMFSTHPMSDERYRTVVRTSEAKYRHAKGFPLQRDRYMDHIAKLRSIENAIKAMQDGEKAMAKRDFRGAEGHFQRALKGAPNDYTGLVMMAKCQLAQEKYGEAQRFARQAKQVYTSEAQAYYIGGIAEVKSKDFRAAYEDFKAYEKILPGNPNAIFFKGYSLEGMGQQKNAATEYYRYLNDVSEGENSRYAYQRLVQWGYIRPRKQ